MSSRGVDDDGQLGFAGGGSRHVWSAVDGGDVWGAFGGQVGPPCQRGTEQTERLAGPGGTLEECVFSLRHGRDEAELVVFPELVGDAYSAALLVRN